MPFKSKAQRRRFAELLVEGKISNETFEEWNRETGRKKLPERVTAKQKARKTKRKAKHPNRVNSTTSGQYESRLTGCTGIRTACADWIRSVPPRM